MIEKLRVVRKSLLLLCKLLMIGVMVAIFYNIWLKNYPELTAFFFKGYLVMAGLYGVILLTFCSLYGALRFGINRLSEINYSLFLSIVVTNILTYFQYSLTAISLLKFSPIILITILQMTVAVICSYGINKLYFCLYPARDMVVIHVNNDSSKGIIEKLMMRKERYKVKERISENCGVEKLKETIDKYGSVLICDIDPALRKELFVYSSLMGKRVYVAPNVQDVMIKNSHSTQLFDTPLFYCKNSGISTEQTFIKRVLDILFSFIAIIVSSPFMLLIWIAIKIEDRGPAIYSQKRLTYHGKEFYVHKFRSMIPDAEKNGRAKLANKDDERITKVGKVIRKIRLDELPQLFNILKGDMSLVGPRPERPEIAKKYEKVIPEFRLRLEVKAGLTGYAQIYGKYNTTPQDKLLLDLMYIDNYSLLLDIKMLFMTLKIIFMPESTEGIENGANLPIPSPSKEKR